MISLGLSLSLTPRAGGGAVALSTITPSADWDGTAASGFDSSYGATPADPTRTTAKPVCRLIVPPNQAFTDELLVGVYAGANNNGSLLSNMGMEKVTFHYEGNSVDVTAPSFQTFADANGNDVTYFGWWVKLAHNGTDGLANLYAEAVPADATMQNRVMGPYTYLPQTSLYDIELEIAPSQSVIAGQRYQDFGAALAYIYANGQKRPHITFTEAGTYTMTATFYLVRMDSWCTVDATAPVTFAKTSFTGDTASSFRPKLGDHHFKGSNITFDFLNSPQFYTEAGHRLWLDGVNIINSGGVSRLFRKGPPITSQLFRENPYFTECVISDQHNACAAASLVRGCTISDCSNDLFTDARCVIRTATDTLNNDHLAIDVNALTVQYTGAGSTATLELTGNSDQSSRTFTARVDGSSVGTFTVLSSEAAWTDNTNYTVQNVVDWLNGLTDWTATLLDDTRRATALSTLGNRGAAFAATDVKSAALTLATHFDLHADWFAVNVGGIGENVALVDNTAINLRAQDVFISASSPAPKDFLVLNNAFANRFDNPTGEFANANAFSQLGRAAHSHVAVAHNTWSSQGMFLRVDQGYNPDAYCLVGNNAVRSIEWAGTPDADLVIANNHLQTGETDPSGATGTVISGDDTSLYVDAANGNFTPAGALLTNKKTPVVKYDRAGAARSATASVGAFIYVDPPTNTLTLNGAPLTLNGAYITLN